MKENGNISVIDAICGSGKSYKMKEYIARFDGKQKFIIAVPTIEMQNQTKRDLKKIGVERIKVISSTEEVNVGEALAQSLLPSSPYRVLIVTQQALTNLGKRILMDDTAGNHLKDFVVLCDEIPSPLFSTSVQISVESNHSSWLRYVDNTDNNMMFGHDMKGLESFYRERHSGKDELKDLIWMLRAGYPGFKRKNKGNGYTVVAFAHSPIMEVVKFSSKLYLLGAGASRSPFLYIASNWCEIQTTEPHHLLMIEPARNVHLNQERVTVHAIMKGRASKQKISQEMHNNTPEYPEFEIPFFDEICRQVCLILKSDFIYTTNKDGVSCPFEKIADQRFGEWATRIPYVSHGLNIFGGQEVHGFSEQLLASEYGNEKIYFYLEGASKAAWLAVSRHSRDTIGYLMTLCELKGGEGKILVELCENFMMGEAAYQMMLRTKLRNRNDTSSIELVFIDEHTMQYFVNNYYPSANIGSIGLVDFKKKEGKASKTRMEVQKWKMQGLTQKDVAAITGKGLRTVQRNWESIEEENTEELEELPF